MHATPRVVALSTLFIALPPPNFCASFNASAVTSSTVACTVPYLFYEEVSSLTKSIRPVLKNPMRFGASLVYILVEDGTAFTGAAPRCNSLFGASMLALGGGSWHAPVRVLGKRHGRK